MRLVERKLPAMRHGGVGGEHEEVGEKMNEQVVMPSPGEILFWIVIFVLVAVGLIYRSACDFCVYGIGAKSDVCVECVQSLCRKNWQWRGAQ